MIRNKHVARAALAAIALSLVLPFGALPVAASAESARSRASSASSTAGPGIGFPTGINPRPDATESADSTDAPGKVLDPDGLADLLAEVREFSARLEAYKAALYEFLYSKPIEEESTTVGRESGDSDATPTYEGVTPVDPSGAAEGGE